MTMPVGGENQVVRSPRRAFAFGAPIGMLGGLIGLGGAEFRLPVLAGPFRYPARQAVPLNLAVSLATLAGSLATRAWTLSLDPIRPLLVPVLAIITGAIVAAFFGTALAHRISNHLLEQVILILLVTIGAGLIVEAFLPTTGSGFIPDSDPWRVVTGVLFGLAIGTVSSLLGVAGGEIIIPTLVFAYDAGIKTAGTASLIISIPTVITGVARYRLRGAYADRQDLRQLVAPMSIGSIAGAFAGGLLVGSIPAAVLKLGLGVILIISAWRIFRHSRRTSHA